MNMKKRGEVTTSQLVGIILLVVGFVIVLLIYSQISWTGEIDRQVCHESAVFRGTVPSIVGSKTKDLIPLKCDMRGICFTTKLFGKGNCEEKLGKNFDTIRVSNDEIKQQKEIKQFIAGELLNSWIMMGEGKIQIFKRDFELLEDKGLNLKKFTKKCVRTSIISADDTIGDKKITGLAKYLMEHKAPNGEDTYWKVLMRSDISTLSSKASSNDVLDLNNPKVILFMEAEKTAGISGLSALAGVGGAGLVIASLSPVGLVTTAGIVLVGSTTAGIGGWKLGEKLSDLTTGIKGDYVSGIILVDEDFLGEIGCERYEDLG